MTGATESLVSAEMPVLVTRLRKYITIPIILMFYVGGLVKGPPQRFITNHFKCISLESFFQVEVLQ